MHEKTTLIVVGVDSKTPEEAENERLRDYAKSSGPAGVAMSSEGREEETLVEMAKRYGQKALDYPSETADWLFGPGEQQRSPSMVMEGAGMIAEPGEGGTFTVVMPSGGVPEEVALSRKDQSELLKASRPIEDVHGRDPEMVLMDWMGDEDRIDSDFLTDINPTDEQIDYAVRKSRGEQLIPVVPESVGRMREDIEDYNRFGGDPVSMELDRIERDESDEDSSDILSALMADEIEYSGIQDASEGLSALREDLGRDVDADLLSQEGTRTIYSAYSPQIGRLTYSYDSATGTGRILEKK